MFTTSIRISESDTLALDQKAKEVGIKKTHIIHALTVAALSMSKEELWCFYQKAQTRQRQEEGTQ